MKRQSRAFRRGSTASDNGSGAGSPLRRVSIAPPSDDALPFGVFRPHRESISPVPPSGGNNSRRQSRAAPRRESMFHPPSAMASHRTSLVKQEDPVRALQDRQRRITARVSDNETKIATQTAQIAAMSSEAKTEEAQFAEELAEKQAELERLKTLLGEKKARLETRSKDAEKFVEGVDEMEDELKTFRAQMANKFVSVRTEPQFDLTRLRDGPLEEMTAFDVTDFAGRKKRIELNASNAAIAADDTQRMQEPGGVSELQQSFAAMEHVQMHGLTWLDGNEAALLFSSHMSRLEPMMMDWAEEIASGARENTPTFDTADEVDDMPMAGS